jgi:hypothetical protein
MISLIRFFSAHNQCPKDVGAITDGVGPGGYVNPISPTVSFAAVATSLSTWVRNTLVIKHIRYATLARPHINTSLTPMLLFQFTYILLSLTAVFAIPAAPKASWFVNPYNGIVDAVAASPDVAATYSDGARGTISTPFLPRDKFGMILDTDPTGTYDGPQERCIGNRELETDACPP